MLAPTLAEGRPSALGLLRWSWTDIPRRVREPDGSWRYIIDHPFGSD